MSVERYQVPGTVDERLYNQQPVHSTQEKDALAPGSPVEPYAVSYSTVQYCNDVSLGYCP